MVTTSAGEIELDLVLNEKDIGKNINKVAKSTSSKISNCFGKMGKTLENSFSSGSSRVKDLKNKISQTEQEISRLTDEITKLCNISAPTQEMQRYKSLISSTQKEIEELSAKMEKIADTKVQTDEYKEVCDFYEKLNKRLNTLLEKQEKFKNTNVSQNSKQWKNLQYDIDEVKKSIMYAKGELKDMNLSGTAFKSGKQTEEYKKVAKEIEKANEKLKTYRKRYNQAFAGTESKRSNELSKKSIQLDKLCDKLDVYKIKLQEVSTKEKNSSGSSSRLSKNLGKISDVTKKATSSITKLTSSVKFLGKMFAMSLMFQGISYALNGMKEGFDNLVLYSARANKNASAMATSMLQLKNALASAFQPIITAVVPHLQVFINYLIKAIDVIGKFFTVLLTGEKTYIRAKNAQVDYSKTLKNTEKTAKKTAKAIKSIMAFDRLNVLSSNDKEENSDKDSDNGMPSTKEMFEKVPIDNKTIKAVEKFKKALDKLKDAMKVVEKVTRPLRKAFSKLIKAMKPLIEAIGKGILKFFKRLGKYIVVPGIKLAAKLINKLADALMKMDPDILQAIATAICEVSAAILAIKIGKSIIKKLGDLYKSLRNLSKFQKTTIAITCMIAAIEFAHLKWEKIFDKYSLEEIEQSLHDMFHDIFGDNWFSDIMADWGLAAATFFDGLFRYSPKEWLDGIRGIIKDAGKKIYNNVVYYVTRARERLKNGINKIKEVFNKFNTFLEDVFKKDFSKSFGAFGEIMNAFKKNAENIWKAIKKVFSGIIDFITGVFTGDWDKAWQGVKKIFGGIFDGLVAVAKAPLNLIIGLINAMLQGIFKGINWLIEKLNTFKVKVPKGVPKIGGMEWGVNIKPIDASKLKIPLLATGGYVKPNTPQLAMIGDNRHQGEVVAPEDKLEQLLNNAILQNTAMIVSAIKNAMSGQKSGDIELVVNLGNKKIAREVLSVAAAEKKRMGKTVYNI